jgi:hypothetical protein
MAENQVGMTTGVDIRVRVLGTPEKGGFRWFSAVAEKRSCALGRAIATEQST